MTTQEEFITKLRAGATSILALAQNIEDDDITDADDIAEWLDVDIHFIKNAFLEVYGVQL